MEIDITEEHNDLQSGNGGQRSAESCLKRDTTTTIVDGSTGPAHTSNGSGRARRLVQSGVSKRFHDTNQIHGLQDNVPVSNGRRGSSVEVACPPNPGDKHEQEGSPGTNKLALISARCQKKDGKEDLMGQEDTLGGPQRSLLKVRDINFHAIIQLSPCAVHSDLHAMPEFFLASASSKSTSELLLTMHHAFFPDKIPLHTCVFENSGKSQASRGITIKHCF
ncbi:hypothetical protein RRG08_034364 [Elysia crispata]|uniref:Uncharacterized protein n=1 Tax=Elysia crispata TaxID=231223 RepID=A0AAE0YDA8_9GAST|nr:hypothetical protein RRG08_034364 [Elysia crispata]